MWARPDLLAELKGLGLLRSPALERSFLHVRQESFLPDAFGTLAYADMPLPVHVSPSPPTMPSARFLIARGRGVHDLAFVKLVRQGGETVQMTFTEAPSDVMAGSARSGDIGPVDFGRLFAVEDLLAHAWEGRVTGHYDQHFRDIVDETFAQGPLDPSAFDQAEEPCKDAARRAFQAAYILQSAGELERAADAYERSIRLEATAEAHTFHGWALSFMGRYDAAIEECKRAIEVDPSFGNPYNDIDENLNEL